MNFNEKRQKSTSSRTDHLLRNFSTHHFMIFYPAVAGAVIAYFFLQRHYFFSQNPWKWFSETEAETVKRSLTKEVDCRLAVIRDVLIANTLYTYSSAALIQPPVLTGSNKNTSEWKVDMQKLPSTYGKVMVSFAFAMEGLKFDSIKKQEVLLLGLGGGVVANFLSTLKKAKISLQTSHNSCPEVDVIQDDMRLFWKGHFDQESLPGCLQKDDGNGIVVKVL